MHTCPDCDFQTENARTYANHRRWQHSTKEQREQASKNMSSARRKRIGKYSYEEITRNCDRCGTEYQTRQRRVLETGELFNWGHKDAPYENVYCSRSCANSHPPIEWTDDMRKAASKRSKELWKDPKYAKKVLAQPRMFSSKREKEIREYLQENYPNDKWTFGRIGKYDDVSLNCDMVSHSRKTIIEYDGIWHFVDIHGQLERKQRVDLAMERWAKANNYRLIRIDEDSNPSNEDVVHWVYHDQAPILKIGDRYEQNRQAVS